MAGTRPNIVFILSDDHAAHAIGCYGSRINRTPNLDRIAAGGVRLDNCFCTNSICAPSRATILTGTYSHVNEVQTLNERMDGRQPTFPQLLQRAGYQTAIVGKWHLGHGGIHDPTGFDYWNVLPGQGLYHDPKMIEMGTERVYPGYVTDIITDQSLDWLQRRDRERPFLLMCHHKAPHRPWEPAPRHAELFADGDVPLPDTLDDDYSDRAAAAAAARMRVDRDLGPTDVKAPAPEGLSLPERRRWMYQRYIKDYLRCVAAVDEGVGRLLDYLDAEGLAEDTIVIYSSDQGFFLGDHGWYDKRFFYEESLRMPMLVRYPREIPQGRTESRFALNVDFAQTLLDYAGLDAPERMQGQSLRPILRGEATAQWQRSMYYRYFMHVAHHNVYAHYGVRTERHKLIYYYEKEPAPPEWELFDLERDPRELHNVYHDPQYAGVVAELKAELTRLRREVGDETDPFPVAAD